MRSKFFLRVVRFNLGINRRHVRASRHRHGSRKPDHVSPGDDSGDGARGRFDCLLQHLPLHRQRNGLHHYRAHYGQLGGHCNRLERQHQRQLRTFLLTRRPGW